MEPAELLDQLTRAGIDERAAFDMIGALLSQQRDHADESALAAAQLSTLAREAGVPDDLAANVGVFVRHATFPVAFELLEMGCPIAEVLGVATVRDLGQVPACVRAGVSLPAVLMAEQQGYPPDEVLSLLSEGMPAGFVERYAPFEEVDLSMVRPLLQAGGTWEDVQFLIDSRVSLTSIAMVSSALEAHGQRLDLATLSPSARRLALVLFLTSELDMGASAVVGAVLGDAPFAPELVGLLVDAQDRWLPAWQSILTARALGGDASMVGPSVSLTDWVYPGGPAPAWTLESGRDSTLREWIVQSPALLDEQFPLAPWGLSGLEHLERAQALGVSALDVRLLATEFLESMPVGIGPALATLALGVSREQATGWVRRGVDPLVVGLLVASGLAEDQACELARGRGLHVLTLVASGVPVDQAVVLEQVALGAVSLQSLCVHVDDRSRPIPPAVYGLLWSVGVSADALTWSSLGLDETPVVPVSVLEAAFALGFAQVNARWVSESSSLAVASALAGSPMLERALAAVTPANSTFERFVSMAPVLDRPAPRLPAARVRSGSRSRSR